MVKQIAALVFVLAAATVVLFGGIGPGFYLDDWSSLSGLKGYNQDGDLLKYVVNGVTGFPGRPLAYLTFALQSESWPDDAGAFKVINLIIHLINAALVYVLFSLILRKQGVSKKAEYMPAMIAFVWAILPIQVGSVFYVVQRMNLLATFFVLFALVVYVLARLSYQGHNRKFLLLSSAALLFGYIGIFAKENAVLVGGFILLIELTVFLKLERTFLHKALLLFGCLLPIALVFLYGALKGSFTAGYDSRDFSLVERLLSQGNALIDYLRYIVFPSNSGLNLFNDGYSYPASLSEIITSILGWSAIFAATIIAVRIRKTLPLCSLGWLFFLVGHLLESTVFPLELYFEHRNYLPSLGIILVIFSLVYQYGLRNQATKLFSLALTVIWTLWLVMVSWEEASVWGSPQKFAISALAERPNSLRARQEVSAYYYYAGSVQGATKLLYSIESDFGPYAGTYAQLIRLKCEDSNVVLPSKASLKQRFVTGEFDRGVSVAFRDIWERKKAGFCDNVSWDLINQSLDWFTENPNYQRENIFFLRGVSLIEAGDIETAYSEMLGFPMRQRSGEYQLVLARLALLLDRKTESKKLLSEYDSRFKGNLRQWYSNQDVYNDLKKRLQETP